MESAAKLKSNFERKRTMTARMMMATTIKMIIVSYKSLFCDVSNLTSYTPAALPPHNLPYQM